MSRIGKKPVPVPSNVTATVTGRTVKMKGPKGELSFTVPEEIKVEKTADGIELSTRRGHQDGAQHVGHVAHDGRRTSMHGVTTGYSRTLEIQGVGFRAAMKGKDQLQLNIGFSHDVVHKIPAGVEVKVAGAKQEVITVSGIDAQLVGQVAANIRASRPPEPYQGKGIRYQGEYIFRKEGKKK